jgi:hypothetical protein
LRFRREEIDVIQKRRFRAILAFALTCSWLASAAAQECRVEQHAPIPTLHDLPYSEARKQLVDAGWQPVLINPMHRQNGEAASGNGPGFVERGFHEVVDCSGSGLAQCLFAYSDVYGNVLAVVTAGEDWPEEQVYATVKQWYFDCPDRRH